ncbi:MAG: DNA polymerase III subunit chi [Limnohabitans sp.]|jgi:DNA polymerase III subunit chi|nr:DNA polymerase III subunit chi [Limnohabitans sp.]MDP4733729.1 DNA polymerase III subunit chi [Limnohabitans sp.]MDP4772122.1 DNA polymerase III subunit chi [Limnohabitans sp.]
MTRIEFHFNTSERLLHTCRLVRKARAQGSRIAVMGAPVTLKQLDAELWRFQEVSFLAHCTVQDPPEIQRASPVALGPDPHAWGINEVLLNLGDEVPDGFERFARLIEIVSSDDHGRAQARLRWKHYKSLGYELLQHDLSKASET